MAQYKTTELINTTVGTSNTLKIANLTPTYPTPRFGEEIMDSAETVAVFNNYSYNSVTEFVAITIPKDISGQVDTVGITSSNTAKLTVTKGGTDKDPVFELNNLVQPGGQVDSVVITSDDETKLKVTKAGTAAAPTFSFSSSSGKIDSVGITSADESKLTVTKGGTGADPTFKLDNLVKPGGQVDSVTISSSDSTLDITKNSGSTASNPSFDLKVIGGGGGGGGQVNSIEIDSTDDTKLKVTAGGTDKDPTFTLDLISGQIGSVGITSTDDTKLKVTKGGTDKDPTFTLENLCGLVNRIGFMTETPEAVSVKMSGSREVECTINITDVMRDVVLESKSDRLKISKSGTKKIPSFLLDLIDIGRVNSIEIDSKDDTKLKVTAGGTDTDPTFTLEALTAGKVDSISITCPNDSLIISKGANSTPVNPQFLIKTNRGVNQLKSNLNSITISPILTRKFGDDPEPEPEGYFIDVNETTENKTYTLHNDPEFMVLLNDLNKKRINHSIMINAAPEYISGITRQLIFDNFNGIGDLTFNIPFIENVGFKNNDLDFVFNNTKVGTVIIEEENTGNIYFEGIVDISNLGTPVFKNYSPTTQLFINGYTLVLPEGATNKGSIIDASNGSTTYIKNLTMPGYKDVIAQQYVISDGARVVSQDLSADTTKVDVSSGGRFYPSVESLKTVIVTDSSLSGKGTKEEPLGINQSTKDEVYNVVTVNDLENLISKLKAERINHSITINGSSFIGTTTKITLSNIKGVGELIFNSGKFLNTVVLENNNLNFVFNNSNTFECVIRNTNIGSVYFNNVTDNTNSSRSVFNNQSPMTKLFVDGYKSAAGLEFKSTIVEAINCSTTCIKNVTLPEGYMGTIIKASDCSTVYIKNLTVDSTYNPIGTIQHRHQYQATDGAIIVSQDSSADTLNVKIDTGGTFKRSNSRDGNMQYLDFSKINGTADPGLLLIDIVNDMVTIHGMLNLNITGDSPGMMFLMKNPLRPIYSTYFPVLCKNAQGAVTFQTAHSTDYPPNPTRSVMSIGSATGSIFYYFHCSFKTAPVVNYE